LRYCFVIPVKTGIHTFYDPGFRIKCGMTALKEQLNGYDLKKQSQFAGGQIGVRSYLKGDYDNITACGARKNKAKQSQSPGFARKSEARIPKSETNPNGENSKF